MQREEVIQGHVVVAVRIVDHDQVWLATGAEIADCYLAQMQAQTLDQEG